MPELSRGLRTGENAQLVVRKAAAATAGPLRFPPNVNW
jgi:hypothetical protein